MEGFPKNERQLHINCKERYIQPVLEWKASCTPTQATTSTIVPNSLKLELDKFSTKFAEVEKIRRNKAYSKKEQILENKRIVNMAR